MQILQKIVFRENSCVCVQYMCSVNKESRDLEWSTSNPKIQILII